MASEITRFFSPGFFVVVAFKISIYGCDIFVNFTIVPYPVRMLTKEDTGEQAYIKINQSILLESIKNYRKQMHSA